MKRIDYGDTVQSTLEAVGSTDASLGSGAATALVLSIAVECLALQLSLTTKRSEQSEHSVYYSGLASRLETWRTEARRSFVEDSAHVGAVIQSRIQRDLAGDEERRIHVEAELGHLELANAVLLRLLDLSLGLEHDGDLMLGELGARRAEGEAATATCLARAATSALTMMLASNVRAAQRRWDDYGVEMGGRAAIREMVLRLPAGVARERLDGELGMDRVGN